MFSSMIQNMLSSSGQANAMQRAVQMNSYIKKYDPNWIPVENNTQAANSKEIQSFDKVLRNSSSVKFGDLITNPTTRVNASLYTAQANGASEKLTPKQKIQEIVSRISKKHGVDEKLVNALIKQESGFNPNAKSKVGAMGLMQLMPSTAKGLGVNDPMNPEQNVEGGLIEHIKKHGDLMLG